MDSSLRSTPALMATIQQLNEALVKRFENIIEYAAIDKSDRTLAAMLEYRMQVETAALIHAAESVQALIRQLQEMWLFGQLDTIGEGEVKQATDENARAVAGMLQQLVDEVGRQQQNGGDDGGEQTSGKLAEA